MASAKKGSKRGQAKSKPKQVSPASLLEETEQTVETMVGEVKDAFDNLARHLSRVAAAATKTTASVAEKMASAGVPDLLSDLVDEVKDASEDSLKTLGDGLEALRSQIFSAAGRTGKAAKKKPTAKKTTAKKKPAAKQAPASKDRYGEEEGDSEEIGHEEDRSPGEHRQEEDRQEEKSCQEEGRQEKGCQEEGCNREESREEDSPENHGYVVAAPAAFWTRRRPGCA